MEKIRVLNPVSNADVCVETKFMAVVGDNGLGVIDFTARSAPERLWEALNWLVNVTVWEFHDEGRARYHALYAYCNRFVCRNYDRQALPMVPSHLPCNEIYYDPDYEERECGTRAIPFIPGFPL